MKKLLTVLLTLLVTCSYGQVDLADNFKQLYKEQKYDEIIGYKPKQNENLTAKALYYKAMSQANPILHIGNMFSTIIINIRN